MAVLQSGSKCLPASGGLTYYVYAPLFRHFAPYVFAEWLRRTSAMNPNLYFGIGSKAS
jgi:hypothetical protein